MSKIHLRERPHSKPLADGSQLSEEQEDALSLDLVQRVVVSVLAVVIGGSISCVLSLTAALQPATLDPVSDVGLWVMAGITGLLTTAVVLVINRRHSYSPLLVFGLVPMAVSAFWVFA
ncbi:hypothetical protein [Microlunatus ginsengisoli]|uniref:Transmembrane protein n=1 Tax=Microlunatus ginsengisoli TaxID=363863 RepID=A0ABP7AYU4_9ACTN